MINDAFVSALNQSLRALAPACNCSHDPTGTAEAIPLMRIDHSGEVCAQALYLSQALFARSAEVRSALIESAREEAAHLKWTCERLNELSARPSIFNPLWFAGSIGVGGIMSVLGDRPSLGFLAETERQVGQHLSGHLRVLPIEDRRSRGILRQMRSDEVSHAAAAELSGGYELPLTFRLGMRVAASVMTRMSGVA